jgi:hypothetical protein
VTPPPSSSRLASRAERLAEKLETCANAGVAAKVRERTKAIVFMRYLHLRETMLRDLGFLAKPQAAKLGTVQRKTAASTLLAWICSLVT